MPEPDDALAPGSLPARVEPAQPPTLDGGPPATPSNGTAGLIEAPGFVAETQPPRAPPAPGLTQPAAVVAMPPLAPPEALPVTVPTTPPTIDDVDQHSSSRVPEPRSPIRRRSLPKLEPEWTAAKRVRSGVALAVAAVLIGAIVAATIGLGLAALVVTLNHAINSSTVPPPP
jgi:hypothetical protein